jgi:hypothetical protein
MARGRKRGEGFAGAGNWAVLASIARSELDSVPSDSQARALERVAREHDLTVDLVRRSLSNLRFVEQVETFDKSAAEVLRALPLPAVENIARWYRHDAAGALEAARQTLDGRYTIRALAAAERAARTRTNADVDWGIGLKRAFREQVYAKYLADPPAGFELVQARESEPYALPVDFVLKKADGTLGAVMIVGPYPDEQLYQRMRTDWLMKAVALLQLGYKTVTLIIPRHSGDKYYEQWLKRYGLLRDDAIQVVFEPTELERTA